MTFEHALITRVVDTGEIRSAREVLTTEHFTKVDALAAWNWVVRHTLTHGQPPSRDVLRDQFPRFPFEPSSDPVSSLVERVHSQFAYRKTAEHIEKVMALAPSDPIAAAELFATSGAEMRSLLNAADGNVDVDITKQMSQERSEYELRHAARGLIGLSWPWPAMNERTMGCMAGGLHTFYGRPKIGKTWYLQYILWHLHTFHRERPVLVSREMRAEELRMRMVAISAQVNFERYQRGQLNTAEYRNWEETLEIVEELPPYMIITCEASGAEAADEIVSKAKDYGATVLAVDGGYFFGDRDWEEYAAFTSRLKKRLISDFKVPGLMTTQAARQKKAGGDDIAYSDSVLQDSDLLVKMVLSPEDQTVIMDVVQGRNIRPFKFNVRRWPASDFSQVAMEPDAEAGAGDAPMEVKA